MRHTELKAVGHNIAHSLASGMGFMIGTFQTNVFAEASAEPPGYLEVDFLNGTVSGSPASPGLQRAVELYRSEALPKLCEAHTVDLSAVRTLRVRYTVHAVHGPEFTVTVEDTRGRQSVESYTGWPGKRLYKRRTTRS
jgi:hypothetical protein